MFNYYTTYKVKGKNYQTKAIKDEISFLVSKGQQGLTNTRLLMKVETETRLYQFPSRYQLSAHMYNLKYIQTLLENNFFVRSLERENDRIESFMRDNDVEKMYYKFKIPKKKPDENGRMKFREITAPVDELKREQAFQKDFIENILKVLPHNSAHAYTKGRGIVSNADQHRESNNFINIDFENFFPSITTDVLATQLSQVGLFTLANCEDLTEPESNSTPMSKVAFNTLAHEMNRYLHNVIALSTLGGELPQGTPISPLLSNLVMVPFDFMMQEWVVDCHKDKNIIYTRYSDDLTFSSYKKLPRGWIEKEIKDTLNKHYNGAITINELKTKVSTKYGKNRITGVKVNAENKLSIGYKEKQHLKHMLMNIMIAKASGERLPEYAPEYLGWFSYLHAVEPEYCKFLESRLMEKFNIDKVQYRSLMDYLYNN